MRIGCLIGPNGRTKHSWTLVSGDCAVLIDEGDEVIEWDVDDGHDEPVAEKQAAKRETAIAVQEAMHKARTRDAVMALSVPYADTRRQRVLRGSATMRAGRERLYRSDGTLASRTIGGAVQPDGTETVATFPTAVAEF